jgi:hypothetical protein
MRGRIFRYLGFVNRTYPRSNGEMEDLNEGDERSTHPCSLDAAALGENAGKLPA